MRLSRSATPSPPAIATRPPNSIAKLETHYQTFHQGARSAPTPAYAKAKSIVAEHFDFLNIILRISFSEALSKDILAQGELLSTKLFSVYLEEKRIPHFLLPALEFMSIDDHDEPQINSIKTKLSHLLQQHKEITLVHHPGLYLPQCPR